MLKSVFSSILVVCAVCLAGCNDQRASALQAEVDKAKLMEAAMAERLEAAQEAEVTAGHVAATHQAEQQMSRQAINELEKRLSQTQTSLAESKLANDKLNKDWINAIEQTSTLSTQLRELAEANEIAKVDSEKLSELLSEANGKIAELKASIDKRESALSDSTSGLVDARRQQYLALKALAESERLRTSMQGQLAELAKLHSEFQSTRLVSAQEDADTAEQLAEKAKQDLDLLLPEASESHDGKSTAEQSQEVKKPESGMLIPDNAQQTSAPQLSVPENSDELPVDVPLDDASTDDATSDGTPSPESAEGNDGVIAPPPVELPSIDSPENDAVISPPPAPTPED